MVKRFLKNILENFVYLFIPMGIFYLFLLTAMFGAVSMALSSTGDLIARLSELIHLSASESSTSVNEFLSYAVQKLDWDNGLLETIRSVFEDGWLHETLTGFFATLNATTEGFEAQFTAEIDSYLNTMHGVVLFVGSWCVLGIVLSNYATRFALRRKTARRNIRKFLLAHTVLPIVQSALLVLGLLMLTFVRAFGLLLLVGLLLLSCVISITSAWLLHRTKGLRLRDVCTAKNLLQQLAVIGILLAGNVLLAALLIFINPLLAVLLMIPFVIYSFNVADVNADAFVCSLTEADPEQ